MDQFITFYNESFSDKIKRFAPAVVRLGLSIVFLWFGSQQVMNAYVWTGLIPNWIISMFGIKNIAFVYINGMFEVLFGLFLLMGYLTRVSASLLAIHLFGIVLTVGYNDIGVRDFGLLMAVISVVLYGADSWSLDKFLAKRK